MSNKQLTDNQRNILEIVATNREIGIPGIAEQTKRNNGTVASALRSLYDRGLIRGFQNEDKSVALIVTTRAMEILGKLGDEDVEAYPVYLTEVNEGKYRYSLAYVGRPVIVDLEKLVNRKNENLVRNKEIRGQVFMKKVKSLAARNDGKVVYLRNFSYAKWYAQHYNRSVLNVHLSKEPDAKDQDSFKQTTKLIRRFVRLADGYQKDTLSPVDFTVN